MSRRFWMTGGMVAWGLTSLVFAQSGAPARPAPTRPPLFLSEAWKALPMPTDDHGEWPASQAGVASPNLQLTLHGPSAKDMMLVNVRGSADVYPFNLWTGVTTAPSAATLRDRGNFVDLTDPLAKFRWVVRTSGFHQVRPVVRLADGTWLVGDRATGPSPDFNQVDTSMAEMKWVKLDMARVVAVGQWIDHPDLSKVDEVGF